MAGRILTIAAIALLALSWSYAMWKSGYYVGRYSGWEECRAVVREELEKYKP